MNGCLLQYLAGVQAAYGTVTLHRLPKDADPAKIQSKYQDGVLLIDIGKKEVHPLPLAAPPWLGLT